MIPGIGEKVTIRNDETVYHVQDTDHICGVAKIGIPDTNGIVWDSKWVSYEKIVSVFRS